MLFRNGSEVIKRLMILLVIRLFNCFPIKNNKIFLFSYYGSQYGCNPKYISEYLVKHDSKGQFDLIWAFNDLENKQHITGIRKVKTMSLRYFYELCTCKVIITNYRTTDLFIKRKKQYYIQTWHSSLRLKQIEQDVEDSLPKNYVEMAKRDSQKCDLLLSGCEFSTEIFKRAFWYDGEIFECGTPRNDLLFQPNLDKKEKVLNDLNLPLDSKLVLYAPTFRKDENLNVYNLNFSLISDKLSKKFGGAWIFLVKLHPHLLAKANQLGNDDHVIDVTAFDDTQELLSIADILISDYSSLVFDFAITQRPCFLYIPDVSNYLQHERNLYFDIKELPFVSATSNGELIDKIQLFQQENYNRNLNGFLQRIGSFEAGSSCEKLAQKITEVCYDGKRRRSKKYATETV